MCPLISTSVKEQSGVHRVNFSYEVCELSKIIDNLIADWTMLAHMYAAVLEFADVYNGNDLHRISPKILYIKCKTYILIYEYIFKVFISVFSL